MQRESQSSRARRAGQRNRPAAIPSGGHEELDPVGEASLESFPASDPPAWIGATFGAPRRSTAPKADKAPRKMQRFEVR